MRFRSSGVGYRTGCPGWRSAGRDSVREMERRTSRTLSALIRKGNPLLRKGNPLLKKENPVFRREIPYSVRKGNPLLRGQTTEARILLSQCSVAGITETSGDEDADILPKGLPTSHPLLRSALKCRCGTLLILFCGSLILVVLSFNHSDAALKASVWTASSPVRSGARGRRLRVRHRGAEPRPRPWEAYKTPCPRRRGRPRGVRDGPAVPRIGRLGIAPTVIKRSSCDHAIGFF